MPKTNVVRSPAPHRHIPGGDRMESYIGNTKVIIDETYILSRSDERYQLDYEQLQEAAWAIIDELSECGEEV